MARPPARVVIAGPESAALSARGSFVSAMLLSAELQAFVCDLERLDRELALGCIELRELPLRRPPTNERPLRDRLERRVELDDLAGLDPVHGPVDPLLAPREQRRRAGEALLQDDVRP